MDELRATTFEDAVVHPGVGYRRRRDEIVATFDAWQVDQEAACVVSGFDLADAAATASGKRIAALRNAMLDRPAETFDDVLAKAAIVSWWYVDCGETPSDVFAADRAEMLAKGDETNVLAMALAVLSDLAAMAEARGLTLDRCAMPAGGGPDPADAARSAA